MSEQVYDPLLQNAQKIIMLKNGIFEFDDTFRKTKNIKCLCGHPKSEHLADIADCCLYAEGTVCICDRFVDERSKVILPPKEKLPSIKKKVKEEVQVLEESRLNNYIETLAQI